MLGGKARTGVGHLDHAGVPRTIDLDLYRLYRLYRGGAWRYAAAIDYLSISAGGRRRFETEGEGGEFPDVTRGKLGKRGRDPGPEIAGQGVRDFRTPAPAPAPCPRPYARRVGQERPVRQHGVGGRGDVAVGLGDPGGLTAVQSEANGATGTRWRLRIGGGSCHVVADGGW